MDFKEAFMNHRDTIINTTLTILTAGLVIGFVMLIPN